jgi:hypothetical protein
VALILVLSDARRKVKDERFFGFGYSEKRLKMTKTYKYAGEVGWVIEVILSNLYLPTPGT